MTVLNVLHSVGTEDEHSRGDGGNTRGRVPYDCAGVDLAVWQDAISEGQGTLNKTTIRLGIGLSAVKLNSSGVDSLDEIVEEVAGLGVIG